MADEYKFPDEVEAKEDKIDIEVDDDTPPDDRNREPLPAEVAKELYEDELEDYSAKVKKKLTQMKKLAHDERREKERVLREQDEAIAIAKRVIEENGRLKQNLANSEKNVMLSITRAVEMEMANAKRAYREAYESADPDRIMEAQEKLTEATMKVDKVKNFKPASVETYTPPQPQAPRIQVDPTAKRWQQNNQWFGQDDEMTSLALGLHEKLKKEGVAISSSEYYRRIDETIRKRFPEKFESDRKRFPEQFESDNDETPSAVVAPATRSTGSKKVRLRTSELNIAKKLGLTPEQYAREMLKLESR